MKKTKVGISITVADDTSIWSNGLNQNLAFLVQLLRQVPQVGEVCLINAGQAESLPATLGFGDLGVRLVKPADVTHEIDLVIEMGASLPLEWLRHVRALGTRIVTFLVGHSYPAQAEVPIFERSGGPAFIGTPWHELWTLPQYEKTSVPLLRTVGRVPVHLMPHIWSPMFLDQQIQDLERQGHSFGFRPQASRPGWRAAIFEPNISVAKCCFIPMLACDHAYRTEPRAMDFMMVMNSFHMKDHPTFNRMATHLNLTRDGKATYEPRLAFAECMSTHKMDAVVAHQWENAQNYLYYDALYGGYPLIHNSDFLKAEGMGFHYPGFEAIQGGQCLLQAWHQPPAFWDDYRRRAQAYLKKRSPLDEHNIRAFAQRIDALMGQPT